MKLISFEMLIRTLQERGLDYTYEALERLFYEEPLIIINKEGKAVKVFFEPEEIWDYLENLQEVELWEE
jgi:hypothetical protein